MKKENLQRIADHLKTVPQEEFGMRYLCSCVIGHGTKLFKKYPGAIEFGKIVGMNICNFDNLKPLHWLCLENWYHRDNTPTGAAKRIEYLIEHGKPPSNWEEILDEGEKYPWE